MIAGRYVNSVASTLKFNKDCDEKYLEIHTLLLESLDVRFNSIKSAEALLLKYGPTQTPQEVKALESYVIARQVEFSSMKLQILDNINRIIDNKLRNDTYDAFTIYEKTNYK